MALEVERILKKRINRQNQPEYLLKWTNFDASHNSWEPVQNLMCDFLIDQFETNRIGKVIAAKRVGPNIMYLMKFEDLQIGEEVTAVDCARLFPEELIHFYEQRLIWYDAVTNANEDVEEIQNVETNEDVGGIPTDILYATKIKGILKFWCQWENNKCKWVRATVAKKTFPEVVINFFERNIAFD